MVLGGGGREHALAWKLAQSDKVTAVYVAPGNPGTAAEPKVSNVALTDFAMLAEFAERELIDFTVVGPEAPLASGVVDEFESRGLKIFGPSKKASRIESSKEFAKRFMAEAGIPTSAYEAFSDFESAKAYIEGKEAPIVVKADGLAAGKGVVVAQSREEALKAAERLLGGRAESRIVIEDFLQGQEASFIVMSDENAFVSMATSQDHKRLLDNDEGPNTGGMGAYSPAPVVSDAVAAKANERIIAPAIATMKKKGSPFKGFLYAGLMIDDQGDPSVVEFNCRFGDPETEAILVRLDSDLAELIELALDKHLDGRTVKWSDDYAVGVVLAAKGYPESPEKGARIEGVDEANKIGKVFHCGTRLDSKGRLVVNGGRVLCVVGRGKTLAEAKAKAYEACGKISFAGMQRRSDIADKGLALLAGKR